MEALVMAGGKGTRMGYCGVEKPMIEVGGVFTVKRVIDALNGSKNIDKILVSVSPNTPDTERYVKDLGVETIRTSGEDYVEDLHDSFRILSGKYVLTCPSDMPLMRSYTVDAFIDYFNANPDDTMTAIVEEDVVVKSGFTPSFDFGFDGKKWVLSGMNIMDRAKILTGEELSYSYFMTDWVDLAINMNTEAELKIARSFFLD